MNISKDNYQILFEEKKRKFSETFKDRLSENYFQSPYKGYRHRAEFSLMKVDTKICYGMTKEGKKEAVDSFPITSQKIQDLMNPVLECIREYSEISEKLFQIEFQSSRSEDAMLTLIYHKELKDDWIKIASDLSSMLAISVIGRSKNQKIIIGNEFVTETYRYLDREFSLKLYEQCFSQTNPYICDAMLHWVIENIDSSEGDIMELHCGLGTFTIPLSTVFQNVLATENSRPSIKALKENIYLNKRTNIYNARLSGKETLEAYNGVRKFRRLSDVDLDQLKIDSVFLDPPREGLDQFTIENLTQMKNIIYISCGFESFKRDLSILQKTHDIVNLAMFDQFPYTEHIESGVILKKITKD